MQAESLVPVIPRQHAVAQSALVLQLGRHTKAPGASTLVHTNPSQQCLVPPHAPFSEAHRHWSFAPQNPYVPSAYGTQQPVAQSVADAQDIRQPA